MNLLSTLFSETPVFHCGMSLKLIRIARLKKLAGERGPVEFGQFIGRKTNQTSDLLAGRASFGEKVARAIEEYAGLPEGWLDQDDDLENVEGVWPFDLLSPDHVRKLSIKQRAMVEKFALDLLEMAEHETQPTTQVQTAPPKTKGKPLVWRDTVERKRKSGTADTVAHHPGKTRAG